MILSYLYIRLLRNRKYTYLLLFPHPVQIYEMSFNLSIAFPVIDFPSSIFLQLYKQSLARFINKNSKKIGNSLNSN